MLISLQGEICNLQNVLGIANERQCALNLCLSISVLKGMRYFTIRAI